MFINFKIFVLDFISLDNDKIFIKSILKRIFIYEEYVLCCFIL